MHTHTSKQSGSSTVVVLVAAVAMLVGAAGGWLHGAGTARAPEPAQLTEAGLGGNNGAYATGRLVGSGLPTDVVKWPSSYTPGTVPADTPCSPVALPAGAITGRVIVATGNYRKCV
jgi:hypothetical protein